MSRLVYILVVMGLPLFAMAASPSTTRFFLISVLKVRFGKLRIGNCRLSREQLLALNAEDLSVTFLCAYRDDSRAAGCGDGFHKWAKAVETSWTKALAASDPHVRMKASQRALVDR